MDKYVYDKTTGGFKKKRPGLREIVAGVLRYAALILGAAILFYLVFALAFSTEREQMLEQENRLLVAEHETLSGQLDLLDGALGHLQERDREIYRDLFDTDPASYALSQDSLLLSGELENMDESDLVWDAYAAVKRMESTALLVSSQISAIDTVLGGGSFVPTSFPSIVPLASFSPLQTGASTGKKINPFYKTIRDHSGIDLMAPVGTPVRCSADGQVVQVVRSAKGMGNQVVVSHAGGFRTVYAHLDDIKVETGRRVRQGDCIGTVGQSGSCFAPCLHYEVQRNGTLQDPVHFFFAELDPATYRDMLIVALTTGQSMD